MNRKHLAVLILVAWAAALGWLGTREYARRSRTVVAGRQAVSPGAAYYRVQLGADQVGFALLQVDTLAPTDSSPALVRLQSRLLMAAGDAPDQKRFEINIDARLTTDLRLWKSVTLRGDPDGVVEWTLSVVGDTLHTRIVSGDSTWATALQLDTIPVPVEAVPLWLATYARPRTGRAVSVAAIDLSTLSRRRETWTMTAESTFTVPDSILRLGVDSFRIASYDTVHAWRLSSTDRSVQVHQWLDESGFPIRWWTAGGVALERDAFELAITAYRRVSDSLVGRSALRAPREADQAALRAPSRPGLQLLFPGAEYTPLDAGGPTQRVTGDTISTFEPNSWRSQQSLRPLEPLPMVNPRLAPELLPEPLFSADDTILTARALELRGTMTNARDAAIYLQRWMARNVTTLSSAGQASTRPAGVVLASGAGTPQEKAVLFVALARRMGLPARLVGGLLLTPQGPVAHTWVEVFIGDWVPMDPGQAGMVASPSHVRLVTGGTGGWADLFPLVAGLVGTGRAPTELP